MANNEGNANTGDNRSGVSISAAIKALSDATGLTAAYDLLAARHPGEAVDIIAGAIGAGLAAAGAAAALFVGRQTPEQAASSAPQDSSVPAGKTRYTITVKFTSRRFGLSDYRNVIIDSDNPLSQDEIDGIARRRAAEFRGNYGFGADDWDIEIIPRSIRRG